MIILWQALHMVFYMAWLELFGQAFFYPWYKGTVKNPHDSIKRA